MQEEEGKLLILQDGVVEIKKWVKYKDKSSKFQVK
jgi:hypothetical protein